MTMDKHHPALVHARFVAVARVLLPILEELRRTTHAAARRDPLLPEGIQDPFISNATGGVALGDRATCIDSGIAIGPGVRAEDGMIIIDEIWLRNLVIVADTKFDPNA